MSWSRLLVACGVVAFTACRQAPPPPAPATPSATPTATPIATLFPVPAFEADPAQSLESIRASYRLTLDRRFPLAFPILEEIATGAAGAPVEVVFDGTWQLRSGVETRGALPEYAGFEDVMTLLAARASELRMSLPKGSPRKSAEQLWLRGPVEELAAIDAEWASGIRTQEVVRAGVRALAVALLHADDSLAVADPIAARAMALLALLRASGDAAHLETALLAEAMGYVADAGVAAAKLPANEPVRQYVLGEHAALEAKAKAKTRDTKAAYLWMRRLADHGRRSELQQMLQSCCASEVGIPVLGLRAKSGFSAVQPSLQALAMAVLSDAAIAAGRDASALVASGSLAEAFRSVVETPPKRSGLIGSEPARSFSRAIFHRAVFELVLHFKDRLAIPKHATQFHAQLGTPDASPERDLVDAIGVIVSDSKSRDLVHGFIATMRPGGQLSLRLLERLWETDADGAYARSTLKALAKNLDTRPHLRERYFGQMVGYRVVPVLEPMARAQSAHAPIYHSSRWLALQGRDGKRLEALAASERIYVGERLAILLDMLTYGIGNPTKTRAKVESLLAAYPLEQDLRLQYVDWLQDQREFKAARRLLDAQLVTLKTKKSVLGDTGLTDSRIRTEIAEVSLRERRCADGLRIIEPALRSGAQGPMTRTAYLKACMGDREGALAFIEQSRARYPGANSEQSAMRTYWLLGDYEASATTGLEQVGVLSRSWKHMGAAFARDLGYLPVDKRTAAFQRMVEGGLPFDAMAAFAEEQFKRGEAGAAFDFLTARRMKGHSRVLQCARGYRYLKTAKGAVAAEDWAKVTLAELALEMPAVALDISLLSEAAFELLALRDLPADADPIRKEVHAVALYSLGKTPPEWLAAYFAEGPISDANGGIRVLLGIETKLDDVVAASKATNKKGSLASLGYVLSLPSRRSGNRVDEAVWCWLSVEYDESGQSAAADPARARLGEFAEPPRLPASR